MKLDKDPRLPTLGSIDYERSMYSRLYELFRQILTMVGAISDGRAIGFTSMDTAPTSGAWYQGDQIKNAKPTVQNGGFIVLGWVCVESGEPGVWKEIRCQTN